MTDPHDLRDERGASAAEHSASAGERSPSGDESSASADEHSRSAEEHTPFADERSPSAAPTSAPSRATLHGARPRSVEVAVQIQADPASAWEAISTARGLERWFPLEASIDAGDPGTITLAWGPDARGTARLGAWEEGRRLGWIESHGGDVEVTVDLHVEGRAGGTVVRVVQAGFDAESWDAYLDTLVSGWRYFLDHLAHALERHPGRDRTMVWARRPVTLGRQACWDRILGKDGLLELSEGVGGPDRPDGEAAVRASARIWSGPAARIRQVTPGIHVAALVPDLEDALLFLELEPGGDRFHLGVWLSLYGDSRNLAKELQAELDRALDGMDLQA
ncbi:MAG: SRPBCC domain-containing protein [Gemmatimonadota bacterium]